MAKNLDFSTLDAARDPLFLVDSKLAILWHNQAATDLLPTLGKDNLRCPLSDIFPSLTRQELLSVHGFGSIPVLRPDPESSGAQHAYHAVLLEVSGIAPDQVFYLVSFQSTPSPLVRRVSPPETFATIAHDLKNPLSAIFGYADALLDNPAGHSFGEREVSIIARIRGTAARAIEMVRNYQQLAEIEAGVLSKRSVKCDLNTIVKAVIEHTWREDKRTPKLQLNLSPNPLPVAIESIQLERITSNLFVNALRYTPPTGTISIKSEAKGNTAQLVIQNSAPLIPLDEIPQLFERNQRGSTSIGTVGSGLGLYIVNQLVSAAGGTVSCRSDENHGTQFSVTLPRPST